MSGQKGQEFALCLNSINRDIHAYPEPNDFTLDLKDRYDLQMMVLGSFEFPYNQWTIEEPWSRFCYDVGLSIFSLEGRTLTFEDVGSPPATVAVTMLPAPFTAMRRTSVTSNIYRAEPTAPPTVPTPSTPHGLGFGSLSAFPNGAVRLILLPTAAPVTFTSIPVTRVISRTEVQVDGALIPANTSMSALLVVTTANTRTFRSPSFLSECLQAFCDSPFPGLDFLRRLRFSYDASALELSLEVHPATRQSCEHMGGADDDITIKNTSSTDLLRSLSFHPPAAPCFVLPPRLVAGGFPSQTGCSSAPRFDAKGLPACPVCLEYDVRPLPPTCTRRGGPLCKELGLCTTCVQIPPGNYEPVQLRAITEHHMNSRHFLEIPPRPATMAAANIYVFGFGTTPAFSVINVATPTQPIAYFHPARVAQDLSTFFANDAAGGGPAVVQLRWTYEDDRFVARPSVPGTYFRIVWPQADGSQNLPFRLSVDEGNTMATELRGRKLNYVPCPTNVVLPTAFGSIHGAQAKQYIFTAYPKLSPGNPLTALPPTFTYQVTAIPLEPYPPTGSYVNIDVVTVELGKLPLEVPVLVYDQSDLSTARFGVVVCHSPADNRTLIQILPTDDPIPNIDANPANWFVDVIPLNGGAVNVYFSPAQRECWSRLAEIYGFRSGGNLFTVNPLLPPAQWNLEQPSYILVDLGLQHVSATITHRCGNSVLSQFFCKLVLFPNFREVRLMPAQAIGSGVSVVSSLHFRILNPWHQPYQLHGRNWSITVILASNTKAARTDCL